MIDPVSRSLDLLADGLRPYVAARVEIMLRRDVREDIAGWDVQQLLVFMWERWNDVFRTELSFVERCLVSELREYRNRWAHQSDIAERDVYRIIDGVERLLTATNSPMLQPVAELRRESLHRLWQDEVRNTSRVGLLRRAVPFLLCGVSALSISVALLTFLSQPWSLILSLLVVLATMRIAWLQSERESVPSTGPRECSHCGRIIYSADCPYCKRTVHETAIAPHEAARSGLSGAWTTPRLPAPQEPRTPIADQTPGVRRNNVSELPEDSSLLR